MQPGTEKILPGQVIHETLGPAIVGGWADIQRGGEKSSGLGLRLSPHTLSEHIYFIHIIDSYSM